MKHILIAITSCIWSLGLCAVEPESLSNADILKNVITDNRPSRFSQQHGGFILPEKIVSLIYKEMNIDNVRNAMIKLNSSLQNQDSESAIKSLESKKAIGSLQACLVHPNDDVKILAADSLREINDPNCVPFLLSTFNNNNNYFTVSGSENATIHDAFLKKIGMALSKITGISVNADALRQADHTRDIDKLEAWCRDKNLELIK